jgi:ABC-type sugar transport system ATPase subunit
MTRLLEVTDLRVSHGAVVAVNDVSLTVDTGEIVGLIGPNGAGKSSFIDALTGAMKNRGGTVAFEGASLDQLASHAVARRGLVRTFQSVELFDDLTVRENLLVAAEQPTLLSSLRDLIPSSRYCRWQGVVVARVSPALSAGRMVTVYSPESTVTKSKRSDTIGIANHPVPHKSREIRRYPLSFRNNPKFLGVFQRSAIRIQACRPANIRNLRISRTTAADRRNGPVAGVRTRCWPWVCGGERGDCSGLSQVQSRITERHRPADSVRWCFPRNWRSRKFCGTVA